MQELIPHDIPTRSAFFQWLLQHLAKDPMFKEKVSFMDELCFTRTGITSIQNRPMQSDENTHVI
jgi:hypothetical protein